MLVSKNHADHFPSHVPPLRIFYGPTRSFMVGACTFCSWRTENSLVNKPLRNASMSSCHSFWALYNLPCIISKLEKSFAWVLVLPAPLSPMVQRTETGVDPSRVLTFDSHS